MASITSCSVHFAYESLLYIFVVKKKFSSSSSASLNYLIVEEDVHVAAHLKDYHVLLHTSVRGNILVTMYINKFTRNIESDTDSSDYE